MIADLYNLWYTISIKETETFEYTVSLRERQICPTRFYKKGLSL